MKLFRFLSAMCAAALLFGAVACNELNDPSSKVEKEGKLVININSAIATKTTTDVLLGEETIKDLQIYIFRKNGNTYELYRYKDTVLQASSRKSTTRVEESINTNEVYAVAVFANGLASNLKYTQFQNLAQLRQQAVALVSSVPGPQGQFTMYGETTQDIDDVTENATKDVSITVTRFVSRIRLMTVQNRLPEAYGALTVRRVFVINAYDQWNFFGTGTSLTNPGITGRFNWGGQDESGVVITTANQCKNGTSAYGDQTFNAVPQSINNYFAAKAVPGATEVEANTASTCVFKNNETYNGIPFYVYPNLHADDPNSDTFRGAISKTVDAPTRLVVYAEITNNGQTMGNYYPVTVPAMARNKSYDVNLIVTGFGSDHPNKEPEKGSMSVTVTVKDWEEGSEWTHTY